MDKIKILHHAKSIVRIEKLFNSVIDAMLKELDLTREDLDAEYNENTVYRNFRTHKE